MLGTRCFGNLHRFAWVALHSLSARVGRAVKQEERTDVVPPAQCLFLRRSWHPHPLHPHCLGLTRTLASVSPSLCHQRWPDGTTRCPPSVHPRLRPQMSRCPSILAPRSPELPVVPISPKPGSAACLPSWKPPEGLEGSPFFPVAQSGLLLLITRES